MFYFTLFEFRFIVYTIPVTKRQTKFPTMPPFSALPPLDPKAEFSGADFDPKSVRKIAEPMLKAGRAYFRFEVLGLEHIPEGPSLVVGNHSGGKLPVDMLLFGAQWQAHFNYKRPLYTLAHDILFKPSRRLGQLLRRLGMVEANPTNASRLLKQGHSVAVMPGGEYETYRPFSDRNVVDFDGRKGWLKTALRNEVPICPVVCIGGHEIFFTLSRGEKLARMLRLDKLLRVRSFPITLGFPWGLYIGPIPAPVPLPARITAQILPPVWLQRDESDHRAYTQRDADCPEALDEMYQMVTGRMQSALAHMANHRRYPVIG